MRIIINGVGIAGPTLAYWLRKSGHEVLLVEQAPRPRTGGYAIDFWGVGYDIAEKMGLIPRIRELGYQVREVLFVDRQGRKRGGFSVDAFSRLTNGRFTSLRRSDLAAVIYDALEGKVETLFGDSVAAIVDEGDRVRVSFGHAPARGRSGHRCRRAASRVRRLVFGPEEAFEVSLGYHVAAFEVDGYRPRDELVYISHGAPGRQVSRLSMRDDKTLFLFVFRDEYLTAGEPSTEPEAQGGAGGASSPVSAGSARRSSRQWGKPATSTSTASARFGWTAGRKAARHLSAMRRPAYPSWPEKARAWRWPRRTCWRASFAIAGAITVRPSPATRSG